MNPIVSIAVLLAFFVMSTLGSNECKIGLHGIGCLSNSDCGDFNGHTLECSATPTGNPGASPGQCLCPPDNIKCTNRQAADSNLVPQFGSCSAMQDCMGHGQYHQIPNISESGICQEPLVCIRTNQYRTTELPQAICHTCSSCKDLNKTDVDCRPACENVESKNLPMSVMVNIGVPSATTTGPTSSPMNLNSVDSSPPGENKISSIPNLEPLQYQENEPGDRNSVEKKYADQPGEGVPPMEQNNPSASSNAPNKNANPIQQEPRVLMASTMTQQPDSKEEPPILTAKLQSAGSTSNANTMTNPASQPGAATTTSQNQVSLGGISPTKGTGNTGVLPGDPAAASSNTMTTAMLIKNPNEAMNNQSMKMDPNGKLSPQAPSLVKGSNDTSLNTNIQDGVNGDDMTMDGSKSSSPSQPNSSNHGISCSMIVFISIFTFVWTL